jgi:membrane protease YdiL (CAAX protease family)
MHDDPLERTPRPTLAQQCGLSWPRPALSTWPPDAHLVLAVLLAVPVWAAIGLFFGPAMYVPSGWTAWVSFVLVYPVVEELLFRGVLQGEALRLTTRDGRSLRAGPVTWANVLVTLVFVAMHLLAQPLIWALAVIVPSLVFGHLRERFASVWPAVLVHAVYNAGFGLAAWLAHR